MIFGGNIVVTDAKPHTIAVMKFEYEHIVVSFVRTQHVRMQPETWNVAFVALHWVMFITVSFPGKISRF